MNNNKILFKFLISCFVLTLSSGVQATTCCDEDFTDDFDKSKVGFKQQYEDWPAECLAKLANKESFIDPVIECYDKKNVKKQRYATKNDATVWWHVLIFLLNDFISQGILLLWLFYFFENLIFFTDEKLIF